MLIQLFHFGFMFVALYWVHSKLFKRFRSDPGPLHEFVGRQEQHSEAAMLLPHTKIYLDWKKTYLTMNETGSSRMNINTAFLFKVSAHKVPNICVSKGANHL